MSLSVSLLSVLCAATSRSLVQRSPTEGVSVCVSVSVIRCKNNPLHLNEWVEEVRLRNKETLGTLKHNRKCLTLP